MKTFMTIMAVLVSMSAFADVFEATPSADPDTKTFLGVKWIERFDPNMPCTHAQWDAAIEAAETSTKERCLEQFYSCTTTSTSFSGTVGYCYGHVEVTGTNPR